MSKNPYTILSLLLFLLVAQHNWSVIFLGVISSVARSVGVGFGESRCGPLHYLIHVNAPLLVASHEAIVEPSPETETQDPAAAPKDRDQPAQNSTSEPEIDMGRKV